MATITSRRKRIREVTIPEVGTPEREAWDARQAKLQKQHAASFAEQRQVEVKAFKALKERRRHMRRRDQSGGTLFGSEDLPIPPQPVRPIVPPRGPKTHGNKVINDGDVPVLRDKRKAKTKVEAARERQRRRET